MPRPVSLLLLTLLLAATLSAKATTPAQFDHKDPDEKQPPTAFTQKYNTLAHRALDLEADEANVSAAKYRLLDDLIDAVKQRVTYDPALRGKPERKQAVRILKAIDEVFGEHNVLFPPGDYDVESMRLALSPQKLDRQTLDRMLRIGINTRRRERALKDPSADFLVMDCDITSILAVSIAQGMGIDRLHLVDLPDHMFVRWELHDGSHVSWDTNDARVVSDKDVAEEHEIARRLRNQRVYLASMSEREAMGFLHFLRAGRFETGGDFTKATADLEKALELYPQSTQIKADLAWRYAVAPDSTPQQRNKAMELAKAALEVEKTDGNFWAALAAAEAALGQFDKATQHIERAQELAKGPQERGDLARYAKQIQQKQVPRD